MTRPAATPAATAALAVLSLLFTACSGDPDDAVADSSSNSPTPAERTSSQTPTDWTPVPEAGDEVLPPGRYGLTVAEDVLPDLPYAVMDTTRPLGHFSNWILTDGDSYLGYWTVHAVYRDPCNTTVVQVDTVEEAAAALRAQRRSRVSAIHPITLDGHQGRYVEVEVPEATDFDACPEYHAWDIDAAGGGQYWQSPGLHGLWILDIDGDLVALEAAVDPHRPQGARKQLVDMIESVDFVARS